MEINIHNYEAYFLDFHEGRLSENERKDVLDFVAQNPLLKNSFQDFENISLLPAPDLSFGEKIFLKKDVLPVIINESNITDYLILESENMISAEELNALDIFVAANREYNRDRILFKAAKVTADFSVSFPLKSSLKQNVISTTVNAGNIEEILIAESEGLLSKADIDELNVFLSANPSFNKARELYAAAKVTPDYSIVFEGKSALKRNILSLNLKRIAYFSSSVAAALILFFAVSFLLKQQPSLNNNEMLSNNDRGKTKNEIQAQNNSKTDDGNTSKDISYDKKTDIILPSRSGVSGTVTNSSTFDRTEDLAFLPSRTDQVYYSNSSNIAFSQFLNKVQFRYDQTDQQYQDVKLAEVIQYAEINEVDPQPLRSMFRNAGTRFASLFIDDRRSTAIADRNAKIDFWNVAEAGVYTFNNLTKKDVELDLLKDESGDVVAYSLKSDLININRDVKEKE